MKTISQLLLMTLLLGLTIQLSPAQTKTADSLRIVLAGHPQADTFRVNRLNDLASALLGSVRENGFDSLKVVQSDVVLAQALRLGQKLKYTYGQAVTLFRKRYLYRFTGATEKQTLALLSQAFLLAQQAKSHPLQLDILGDLGNTLIISNRAESRRYFQRGLALARTWHLSNQIIDFLYWIGTSYSYDNQYVQGLEWQFQALKLAQQTGNRNLSADQLRVISDDFLKLADYDQALSYALKYQQVAQQVGNKQIQHSALFALGNCYRLMGRNKLAIANYKQLLSDSTYLGDRVFLLRHLGYSYERLGDWSTAIRYIVQSLAMAKKNHNEAYLYHHYVVLARAYQKANQPNNALYYGLKTLQVAHQYAYRDVREAYLVLAQVYAERHNYARAYTFERRYVDLKDSLLNGEVTRKATALQFTERMSHQQSQIALLQKDKQLQAQEVRRQRQLLYASLLVVGLIGSLLGVVYRNNRQKQRTNRVLAQQKMELEQTLHELKNTQTTLIHKEKMASLGELTAGIAHEIQNPLNFVTNFSELSTELVDELEEQQHKPTPDSTLEIELLTDLKDNLNKIHHHGHRASSIVKGMLEHARRSTGERTPTDLNKLIDEYLRLAYHGFRAKDKGFNAELGTQFDESVGEVVVMPQEMGRVMLNLFSNAFYAVRQQQHITLDNYHPLVRVRTDRDGNQVVVTVQDNGVGIADSVKAKIFQPFFTTKPTGEGTGLGLSLSYDIITKGHGGSLTVSSQPGPGSEFVIILPVEPTVG